MKMLKALLWSLPCIWGIIPSCPAVKLGVTTVKQFKITAYCPCRICCGKHAKGITASGHIIKEGDRFAAAPPQYLFGTKMNIPFYGLVDVRDRGGAIRGDCLDVFFDTHQKALNWGIKILNVEVWE